MKKDSFVNRFGRLTGLLSLSGLAMVASASAQEATLKATFSLSAQESVTIPVQNGRIFPNFEEQLRPTISLNGVWKKWRFAANDALTLLDRTPTAIDALETEGGGAHLPEFDDSAWETKTLPAVENTMNGYQQRPEYYEDGVWYRRTFTVPDSLVNQKVILKFLSVNYVADVWVNGTHVGYHEGGFTPFAFLVSPHIVSGTNTIAVRVDNPEWGKRKDIVPYTKPDWFNYTGIIHDVMIEFRPGIFIARADIKPLDLQGNCDLKVFLDNPAMVLPLKPIEISWEVYEAKVTPANKLSSRPADLVSGSPVATGGFSEQPGFTEDGFSVLTTTIQVPTPRIWSPKYPNLYILKVKTDLGDSVYTQFGIRTFETNGNKVLLNSLVTFFASVARHEDHPVYGRSMPVIQIQTDLDIAKSTNATMLRTAHYPNHPFTYLYTDRIGLAVMEEIPVWWFDHAEAWIIQNERRQIHRQMFREMVFRDYNRPSILLWSLTNECADVENRKIFMEAMDNELDTLYPDGRLTTQSAASDRPGPHDDSQHAVDVAGWTMYYGVFYGSIGTITEDTKKFLSNAMKFHPGKPIVDTEYGRWSREDHKEQGVQTNIFNGTFPAFEAYSARSRTGAVIDTNALMAATWWTVFDWYTHTLPDGFQSMGLYQMDRTTAKSVLTNLKTRYSVYATTQPVYTAVEETEQPRQIRLNQNYPNPFNPGTIIEYSLPVGSPVSLQIYDNTGRLVGTLVNQFQPAGEHQVLFDAGRQRYPLASGMYLYRLVAGGQTATGKMVLLK
ncbi:MAG: T9SS type A sorting domain-containing protein [Bacteroidetes bacterium]|nr:T9SS type A sorting domain-containing protein [Bacteroidota bacterium]